MVGVLAHDHEAHPDRDPADDRSDQIIEIGVATSSPASPRDDRRRWLRQGANTLTSFRAATTTAVGAVDETYCTPTSKDAPP